MPIYEYECKKCLARYEVKRGFDEKGGDACPTCGGEGRRIYSPTALIFKGPGFYITDSRKKTDRPEEGQSAKPAADKPVTDIGTAKPSADASATTPVKSDADKPATKPETAK
jgi:putative FmdB family regulatory protein